MYLMFSKDHARPFWATALLGLAVLFSGCEAGDDVPPDPPSVAEISAYYEYDGELSVEMSGNVAQVTVAIDREQFRAGGQLWARASPYIFLLSPGTRQAFADHPGLGGVRVIVRYEDGVTLAQALLERGSLTPGGWNRALAAAAEARTEGTERPGLMRELVRWGEDHTDFQYNADYIPGVQ